MLQESATKEVRSIKIWCIIRVKFDTGHNLMCQEPSFPTHPLVFTLCPIYRRSGYIPIAGMHASRGQVFRHTFHSRVGSYFCCMKVGSVVSVATSLGSTNFIMAKCVIGNILLK